MPKSKERLSAEPGVIREKVEPGLAWSIVRPCLGLREEAASNHERFAGPEFQGRAIGHVIDGDNIAAILQANVKFFRIWAALFHAADEQRDRAHVADESKLGRDQREITHSSAFETHVLMS